MGAGEYPAFIDPLLFFSIYRFKYEVHQWKGNLLLQFAFINNVNIRIVHEKIKSQSAHRLVHEIINLLTFPYLPIRQNLTSTKQLLRYTKLGELLGMPMQVLAY